MSTTDPFILDLNRKKEAAWKRLYEDFYPALCAYSARIIKDDVVVEDVVQDCLIALWYSSSQFPNLKTLTSWLYRSVYTRSLNVIRDNNQLLKRLDYLKQDGGGMAFEDEMIEEAIEEAVVARFRQAISRLSGQQQQIMEMTMEGLKVKEIADRLGVSDNAVKMQKKRAYASIREQLGETWSILLFSFFRITAYDRDREFAVVQDLRYRI